MKLYKFFNKSKNSEIYGYIYYVYSTENYETVYTSLKKVLPNIVNYENINITNITYEINPKLSFKTTWNTNMLCILNKCEIYNITQLKEVFYIKI